ncbi:MAG: dicarboxylate/amino acid:cation symporter [Candidatus Angelobacter sp. Gp1-AA117]|nr:MAG: dicarboxylate/amino acid:cation symporter [Candidatus Angelobacter sp. Gp1-AA117]
MKRTQTKFLFAFLLIAGLCAVLWAVEHYGGVPFSPQLMTICRWAAVLAFCGYTFVCRSLTAWIMAGILIGAEIGYDWPNQAANLQVLSRVFLRLIKTIIAPLIFSTLVVGIAGHSNLKQVGRMGVKALIYFELVTTIALFIGLGAINFSRAGVGVTPPANTPQLPATQKQTASDLIEHIFPENIAKSIAEGQVLQVVVFSIIFGIALALVVEKKRRPLLEVFESLSETMFKFTNIVMLFAPIGVAGAIAYTVGTMGLGIVVNLLKLVATLYAALVIFILCVFLPVALIARLPIKRFLKAVTEPASIAFATASSEAALPRAMEAMEAFGVPRQVVAFVMPTGYSFNLDGSTLYLALASIFVAQAAGIHFSFSQQLLMVFTLMLTSKGVAGVPRATLVILMGTADSFHLPVWPIFIILGVDQLMDMARTSINVVGNCLATAVIARWEGELGKEAPSPAVMDAMAQ